MLGHDVNRALRIFAALGVTLFLSACASPYTRVNIHADDLIQVSLRARNEGGAPVDRGFRHPATISNVRLAHILSAIDVRHGASDEGTPTRGPAVHTDLIYVLGDHLSAALTQADSSQEVVIEATRKERNLGVFTQRYVTQLVAWVDAEDRLQIHLVRVDWAVPKSEDADELREPVVGQRVQRFRVLASESISPIGTQGVAVHWRDLRFRKARHLSVGSGGRLQRRRVLMESPDAVEADDLDSAETPTALPSDPATLRALADLEEARRRGELPESEYLRRRRALLGGTPADE